MHAGIAGDLHRYAAAGLWRGGEFCEALENLERAFELAESVGLRRAQFISAISLASFTDDIGQKEESTHWMEKAEHIADELPSLRTEPGYVSVCFELALPKRDVRELKRLLDLATRYPQRAGREQSRMARALEICIQQLSGALVDPHAAIHDLTDHHLTDGESGNMGDLEVAVAATLFIEAQEPDAARSTVREYLLNYRRGRAAISAMLGNVIRRLDITELPPWCRIYETDS
jgi:hypothetical protein